MVRGSELAFRMLVRSHGVHLCYTPMLKAEQLVAGGPEERRLLETAGGDRPLVVQLAGRDAEVLAEAARLVLEALPDADALDLNLGCPQECAREGRYGAFLQEEPELAAACVAAMRRAAGPVPVFCKIRILGSVEASVAFARGLQDAGCSLLTVHCRSREAKHDGPPDYAHLAEIAAALDIPVVANGGVSSREGASEVAAAAGACGVMAATALLRNPRSFSTSAPPAAETVDLAWEYLGYAEHFPPPSALYLRKHLQWIFKRELGQAYRSVRAGWLADYRTGGRQNYDEADWRVRAWTFLDQPHLEHVQQFRELVRLIAHRQGRLLEGRPPGPDVLSFREIRIGRPEDCEEPDVDWLFESA